MRACVRKMEETIHAKPEYYPVSYTHLDVYKRQLQASNKEERPRVTALLLVFVVVIFFWMSFHQNGLTMTMFARDYTVKTVGPFTYLFFNLWYILAFIGAVAGLVMLLNKKLKMQMRSLGGIIFAGLGFLTYYFYSRGDASNSIAPELFQSFNPLFIVSLTLDVYKRQMYLSLERAIITPPTNIKGALATIPSSIRTTI